MAAEADGNDTPTITSEMNQSDSESQSGEKSDAEFSDGDNTAMGEEVSSNDDMEKIEKEGNLEEDSSQREDTAESIDDTSDLAESESEENLQQGNDDLQNQQEVHQHNIWLILIRQIIHRHTFLIRNTVQEKVGISMVHTAQMLHILEQLGIITYL